MASTSQGKLMPTSSPPSVSASPLVSIRRPTRGLIVAEAPAVLDPSSGTSSNLSLLSPPTAVYRRPSMLARLKERSVSELSLVIDIFRHGSSRSARSPAACSVSPGMASGSTGDPRDAGPSGSSGASPNAFSRSGTTKRRKSTHGKKNMQSTWAAMQPRNIQKAFHAG